MKGQRHKRPKKHTHRRRTPPGAPPGTWSVDPEAPHPVIRVMAYGPQEVSEREISDPRQVRDFLDVWPVTWVSMLFRSFVPLPFHS